MRVVVLAGLLILSFQVQSQDEEFRVYTEHPRLLLTAQRLHRLKLERERQTPRWQQFDLLVKGAVDFPQPGFALALYYQAAGDAAAGKRAIAWALSPRGDDLRQLAIVYDWCQPVLSRKDSVALSAKIRQLIQRPSGNDVSAERDRILAWIALDDPEHSEEGPLQQVVRQWWRMSYAPSLADGKIALPLPDMYALLEILHAIRDNLKVDLRDAAPGYFAYLPRYLVIGNYPASYRAPENEFRIPMDSSKTLPGDISFGDAKPDLGRAALARAAGLALVAYDANALQNQFLQGWMIKDQFSMMTPFGAPYEFLWANPYQPGLSYFQLPLIFHDENSGAVFARSTWDEDADWFGLYGGRAELFHAGRVTVVNQTAAGLPAPHLLHVGETMVIFGRTPLKFAIEGGTVLAIGLKPRQPYLIETDDEEMREMATDEAGTLFLQYPSSRKAGVRIHEEREGNHGKGGA
ncbi:MAG TPA: hypothetical protein VME17_12780 [Bryobacteraceae bacterium]|nr:hypothetical protein [Bryobacteraceae bacterium]